MPRNNPNITIEFKAKGQKPLLDALKKLNEQQKKLANNVKNTGSAVNGFNLRVQKATKTAKDKGRMVDKLNASIAIYRNRILLAAFATGLFAKTVGKLMSVYGEQELAERKLSNALGFRSQALLDFASAQQQATSFGDELTISAMSQISAFTKNKEAIKQATIMATDFAAKTGKTLEESMQMITSSVFGTRNAFKTFGIEMSRASIPTARFNSLMKGLNQYAGGEAQQQMGTYASKVRAMTGAIGDAAEVIGRDFVELLTGVIRGVTKLAEFFGRMADSGTNLAGVMVSLAAGTFVAIKRFKVLNAIMVLTKGAMVGAALSTRRMTVAIKSLAKSTILLAALQYTMELIAGTFGKTEETVEETASTVKTITLDMADLSRSISKMEKDAAKAKLEQVFGSAEKSLNKLNKEFVTTGTSLQDAMRKLSSIPYTYNYDEVNKLFDTFKDKSKDSAEAVEEVTLLSAEGIERYSVSLLKLAADTGEGMKFLKNASIFELQELETAIRSSMENSEGKTSDFDKELLKTINTIILLKKQVDDINNAQSDWLDDLPKTLDNTNDKLTAKIEYLNDERGLAFELLSIEAARRGIYGSKDWSDQVDVIKKKIDLQVKLNKLLAHRKSLEKTIVSQTSQLANEITGMIFSVDVASLTWERFGQTIIGVMNKILAKFVAEWAIWKLFSGVFSGMTAPSLFGWSPASAGMANLGTSYDPSNPFNFHSGGMIPQSYHSGGNVPIIAEEGEFVMRRSAVESIGVENLNRMNRTGQTGGVNVTFSGNVMSNDFIEDVAIPKIKDAIRRGADIGIS